MESRSTSTSTTILFGGDGSEHRVSVASAQNVARHLERASLWFWARDSTVHTVSRESLRDFHRPFESDFRPDGETESSWPTIEEALDDAGRDTVFFLALHGGSGEDGTIQALMEARALAFTGSGARASRLAFDKVRARDVVAARGARVAEAVVVKPSSSPEAIGRLFEKCGKIVLKPIADGSSHGVRVIASERELSSALLELSRASTPYLAEAFVRGTELTIAVVEEEGGVRALPCSEVRLDPGRTFDFDGKYLGKGSLEITPAAVPDETARAAQALACTAHEAVGCAGYSRTDVIVPNESDETIFLEINTLPGLTAASFVPQQLEAASIDMTSFLDHQVHLAARRRDEARKR